MRTLFSSPPHVARRTGRALIPLLAAVGLVACGGSDGSGEPTPAESPAATTVNGRVVDGYIRGAVVFWDCNRNGTLDTNEVSTTSGAGGTYTIPQTSVAGCDLLAHVPWDAVDEDAPLQTVGIEYTMAAAPGRTDVVSPLTTLIYGLVRSGEASDTASADARLRQDLGLTGDTTSDYKATYTTESLMLASHARQLASTLQTTAQSGSLIDAANGARNALALRLGVPGIRSTLALGTQPFLYADNSVLRTLGAVGAARNPANIVLRQRLAAASTDNLLLDQIAQAVTDAGAAEYGFVNFHKLDADQLRDWMFTLMRSGVGDDDAALQRAIEAFRTTRNQALSDSSARFGQTVESETAALTFLTNDPQATIDLALAYANANLNAFIDVGSIVTVGVAGKINSTARLLIQNKKTAARLVRILERLKLGSNAADCLSKTAFVVAHLDTLVPEQVSAATSSCISVVAGIVADTKKVKRHGSIAKTIQASDALQVFTVDLVIDGTDEDKAMAMAKICLDLFDVFMEVASLLDDPATATVLSAIDLGTQPLRVLVAGYDHLKQVGGIQDSRVADATQLFRDETAKAFKSYYAHYLAAYAGYFRVVDSSRSGYVTGVASQAQGTFSVQLTVSGNNLPPVSLRATLGGLDCIEGNGSTSANRTYACPLASSAVALPFEISDGSAVIAGSLRRVAIPQALQPRVDSVTRTPASPQVGDTFTLTVIGQNLLNAGYVLAPFAPCQGTVALAPSTATDVQLVFQCTLRLAAGSALVQLIQQDSGSVVPGTGLRLTVVCGGLALPDTAGTCQQPTPTARQLNDSGQRSCIKLNAASTAFVRAPSCSTADIASPEPAAPQDGQIGPDASSDNDTDGDTGFSFTKLNNRGTPTTVDRAAGDNPDDWACTRDNNTGLVWEVKRPGHATRGVTTLHHYPPYAFGRTTEDLVRDIKGIALCGYSDWRLPTIWELHSLMHYGNDAVGLADRRFFAPLPYDLTLLSATTNRGNLGRPLGAKFAGSAATSGGGSIDSAIGGGSVMLVRGAPIRYEGVRNLTTGLESFATWGLTARTSCWLPAIWNASTQECDSSEPALITNSFGAGILAQRMAQSTGVAWRVPNIKELLLLRDFESDPEIDCGFATESVVSSTYNTASPNSAWVMTCQGIRASLNGFQLGHVVLVTSP